MEEHKSRSFVGKILRLEVDENKRNEDEERMIECGFEKLKETKWKAA